MTATDPDRADGTPSRLVPRPPRPLRAPAPSKVVDSDVAAAVGVLTFLILAMWARHGGLSALAAGWVAAWTSITQLSGLAASAFGLAGLLLIGRPRAIERRYGLDRMFVWHRILGETMALLVGLHVVAALLAWSSGYGVFPAVRDLVGREPYMALATVGALLIGVVTVSSLASLRRRMSYETWYFVHLLAYVGFAASFGHQVVLGGDFAEDAVARWFWIALHLAVLALIVWRRWGTTVRSVLFPLRIVDIRRVADDAVALRLGGRGLSDIEALPGQFFFLRLLRKGWWWQAHPFSLSEAPWSSGLRFTIKARGDATTAIAELRRGTAVAVEGPYGVCTPEVIEDRKVVFIVGGVGVAPVRAILERLTRANEPIVLYRAHRQQDLLHLDELRALAEARGGEVRTLVGPSAALAVKDPFSAKRLLTAVPDLGTRVAVLCGPERLLWAARAGLRGAGVSDDDIHYEHPWW